MEERLKSDSSMKSEPDKLSDGWSGTGENGKRARIPKQSSPPATPTKLDELEKQVNAGWDKPEA